jgi:hypothetical protein
MVDKPWLVGELQTNHALFSLMLLKGVKSELKTDEMLHPGIWM